MGLVAFPSKSKASEFIDDVQDDPAFCEWCLAPLERSGSGGELLLQTARTFDAYSSPVVDVPPDRTDGQGGVIDVSRDKLTICDCGVIDVDPTESRDKETVYQALDHVCSLLEENGVDVDRGIAEQVVDQAFAKGHTGQFCETLGTAIYRSVVDV